MSQTREESLAQHLDDIDVEALRVALHDGVHNFGVTMEHEGWTDEVVFSTLAGLHELSKAVCVLDNIQRRGAAKGKAAVATLVKTA